ncbi:MAG: type I DNA topoisomerase [Sphaerochaetaceae bacterium]|nr:type I DNA topoisomerase [Sphaerochaetaceae bacterium]
MADKTLIIVESPTKATTIRKFLGNDCTVIASKGHIRTLPENSMGINIKDGYKPDYRIDPGKKDVIEKLKSELKNASSLILATDEDREGESISWHLLEVLKPKVNYRRMVFHEITKKAILDAFEHGRDLDMNLVHAQEARRVLDRLYGYSISPVLWSKLSNKKLSAGRVQSPGLKLIVDRERERMNFKKAEYWSIEALFSEGVKADLSIFEGRKIATGDSFDKETGKLKNESKVLLIDSSLASSIKQQLQGCSYVVDSVSEKSSSVKPYPPFTTSTLQQEGNIKLHLSAKSVMSLAQHLYERGFITYHRTDSPALSEEGTRAARAAAAALFGEEHVSSSPRRYAPKSNLSQEAHEAIRPAGETFTAPEDTGLSGKDLQLYTLIYKRTLASQMKDARKITSSVEVVTTDGKATFKASASRYEYAGFRKLYVEDEETKGSAELTIPALEKGTVLNLSSLSDTRHETMPRGRYTEASLVKELEALGIGRPSTYATIIENIIDKNYVVVSDHALIPTFTGFAVMQVMEHFSKYTQYDFTSAMENELDEIAEGKKSETDYLKNFYEGEDGLENQIKLAKESIIPKEVKEIKLPQLSEGHSILIGQYGPYVQNAEGKNKSVPKDWLPENVTDQMIDDLFTEETGKNTNTVVAEDTDGTPVFRCSGKYGDYWQLGDIAKTKDVKRFKIPSALLNKEVPSSRILEFFTLPKTVGKTEDGQDIIANIGRFGAYINAGKEFRNIKTYDELFSIDEKTARELLSAPKQSRTSRTASKTAAKPASNVIKNFGEYEGKNLSIMSGRYGFYIKYGTENFRLPKELQHDEQACKDFEIEKAIEILKK